MELDTVPRKLPEANAGPVIEERLLDTLTLVVEWPEFKAALKTHFFPVGHAECLVSGDRPAPVLEAGGLLETGCVRLEHWREQELCWLEDKDPAKYE